jgi:hypothetical protein
MMTEAEVRVFQQGRLGPSGAFLVVDGDYGPATQWAEAISELPYEPRSLVLHALGYVGVHESQGPNRDPIIDGWIQRCPGARLGDPYCAAFVSKMLYLATGGRIDPKECSVARLVAKYAKVEFKDLRVGDLAYWLNPNGTGHIGIVSGIDFTGAEVALVEGNSNNAVRVGRRLAVGLSFCRPFPPGEVPGVWSKLPLLGSGTR